VTPTDLAAQAAIRIGELVDLVTSTFAPRFTLRRQRARYEAALLRAYDAASSGRRTQGWRRNTGDVNAVIGQGLERTREVARDLVRNNPYAAAALNTIADHVVGWGIVAQGSPPTWWKPWAETTACDADGRYDFAGLQKQVTRTTAEAGECLVRRRWRRPEDGLPIPLQLQLIEPDLLDTTKEGVTGTGGQIIQGVEFSPIGARVNYWLFDDHPGASGTRVTRSRNSRPIPASEILHVFKPERPGQVRGMSWLAPVILRLKDFDDYEDAALLKQKIAACLAVLTTDPDGTAPALGTADSSTTPAIDAIEPGMIANLPTGRTVTVVQPPSVSEHEAYARTVLRAIASGIGITYEDLCGDYQGMPFSAARMSRIRSWARIEDWRWRLIVPQFCDPSWRWANQAAAVMRLPTVTGPIEWTAPAMPAIDPEAEASAYQKMLRIGATSWPDMMRERGLNPDKVLGEIEAWNKKLDRAGVILDSDPRRTTQAGNPRDSSKADGSSADAPAKPPAAPSSNGNGNGSRNGAGHLEDRPAGAASVRVLQLELADLRARLDAVRPLEVHAHVAAAPAPNIDARTDVRVEAGAVQVAPPPPAEVYVDARTTLQRGAVEVAAAPPAEVHVDARTTLEPGALAVSVAPPSLTIAEGAIRAEVHPPAIAVDARTTLEPGSLAVSVAPPSVTFADGAVRTEVHPPAVEVDARTTIAEGAVQISSPVTVQQAPAPPTVTVVRVPARPPVEPGSGIPATDAE